MTVAVRTPNGVTTANTGTANVAGNVGLTINVPSGVVNGDVMYMAIHAASSTGTFATPSGWSVVEAQFASTGQASSKMMVWRKLAASEPASYTITWGAAGATGRAAAAIVAFTGVNGVTFQQSEAKDAGAGPTSTEVLPSVSPTTATMILGFASAYTPSFGTTTWTSAVMTEVADTSSSNASQSNASMSANTQSVSSGATGTRTSTGSRADLRPCGVMVALDPSNPQTVTPSVLALVLATFAPTVTATSGTTVTPGVSALTLATFAPSVTTTAHQTVTPAVKTLALAAFAPVIRVAVTPSTKALAMSAFAPTITVSDHKTVTPGVTALAMSSLVPTITISADRLAVPGPVALAMTAFAPSVVLTDHKLVTPNRIALTLTAFAPDVFATDTKVATPTTAALALTSFVPTVLGGPPLPLTAIARSIIVPEPLSASLVVPGTDSAEID